MPVAAPNRSVPYAVGAVYDESAVAIDAAPILGVTANEGVVAIDCAYLKFDQRKSLAAAFEPAARSLICDVCIVTGSEPVLECVAECPTTFPDSSQAYPVHENNRPLTDAVAPIDGDEGKDNDIFYPSVNCAVGTEKFAAYRHAFVSRISSK